MQIFTRSLLTIALLGITFHTHTALASTEILARFGNGEVITEKDLSDYLSRRVDLRAVSRNAWGVENVLREMAMTRVLLLEEGMQHDQSDTRLYRFDDKNALPVHKRLMPACVAPENEAAARAFYDKNPEAFRVPPMARLSRIMLPVKERVDGEPAVGWLLAQAQAVASGKRKFDEVVRQASVVHKLDPQGDLGWVTLTDEAQILRALADANTGDMVGPVTEGEFVYFFQILAKRDARLLSWEEVASSASGRAVRYCREQGAAQLRERLFKKYAVEVDKAAIRALFSRHETKKQVTQ